MNRSNPFRRAVRVYAHNLLAGTSILRAGRRHYRSLDDIDIFAEIARTIGPLEAPRKPESNERPDARFRRLLQIYLRRNGRSPRVPPSPESPFRGGLAVLATLAGLNETDRRILGFLFAVGHSNDLADALARFENLTVSTAAEILAAAVALPVSRVARALRPASPLSRTGLVTVGIGPAGFQEKVLLKHGLLDLVGLPSLDREKLLSHFLPRAPATTLAPRDFRPLQEELVLARDLLAAALKTRRRGVNVLLYGPTGTGKTELARLLAREAKAPLYAVGKAEEAAAATTFDRLTSLRLGNRLVGESRALLLFDEVEDLFEWKFRDLFGETKHGSPLMSKQWFNDLLETNTAPTIWISNCVEGIDPAFLRRFCYAIETRPAGVRQRARVLERHLGRAGAMPARDVDAIAQRFAASPAQIGSAVAVARLLAVNGHPDRPTLERVLAPVEKLVTGVDPSRATSFDPSSFHLDAINAGEDLRALGDRLAGFKPGPGPGISLCLYGPPGTGKSELVKYLAWRMDRRVVHRRVSDLVSKWVGDTEKNIAASFREAEEEDAVLLFDEADSFLQDRSRAERSWEVTQVNEFLQQLETSRGIVACTTNLFRDLDEAAMRRFVFKVEFRFLKPAQSVALFDALLLPLGRRASAGERDAAHAHVRALAGLAPGDFAAVSRRIRALGARPAALELASLLGGEVRAKRASPRTAGF